MSVDKSCQSRRCFYGPSSSSSTDFFLGFLLWMGFVPVPWPEGMAVV
jgi:hypothetical protein